LLQISSKFYYQYQERNFRQWNV